MKTMKMKRRTIFAFYQGEAVLEPGSETTVSVEWPFETMPDRIRIWDERLAEAATVTGFAVRARIGHGGIPASIFHVVNDAEENRLLHAGKLLVEVTFLVRGDTPVPIGDRAFEVLVRKERALCITS